MTTLLVTNDFPPRAGGIQTFVHALACRQPPGSLVVLAPDHEGAREFDMAQPFPVVRLRHLAVPTPRLTREVIAQAESFGCDTVWFGAALPLALMAAQLRKAGISRIVAQTHGHEAAWSPMAYPLLRRIAEHCDAVTFLGDYTHRRLAAAMPDLVRLSPGVDTDAFHPDVDGSDIREIHGLGDHPVIVCVSRLVRRKGQDVLIRALSLVRRQVPDALLLLVSSGADEKRLRRMAGPGVVFTGEVDDLPAYLAAGDVFAMPCRTRLGGLNVEGLGIVYLEASASGLPVVAGRSGGAPETVLDGETGYVVDGRSVREVADRLIALLTDPDLAHAMGAAGRAYVEKSWRWDTSAATLTNLLAGRS
ncbi:glycosyltransferase family 4 protein [Fodinicola acaciae]|uniref:glycosyltransferase family 4 protein n=1 Tax=Fodinicola acaciae TaxID=2681555 RepID=UPI0013D16E66|nr:glycosyltransferase family 4 protein [Fodinicola acaciae]